ncbi:MULTISPECIES: citrate (pro-3S)-lyase subunit beta [Clostridium]|uniref:Citrate lyase subunit beta n=2 Tax=Clostridium TaxID=1485 RepID=M1N3Z1_9CLOT|nr:MULTISPECIES: citrate (pro-3S)-lyase subunit beta [Clostridium]AGF58172.1 citrate lyase subunit beta [Clostridium saccharoperbutylacetonicum N1-4(HMT)]AQR96867.1 citrate lyase subunit beta [Clostridium saccharoperbutylacetonicum]NRT61054.1 citrate lyase subunit beta/citryl-CoA lyase [Clostridium saccharoperbutylacetonicum]NSB24369.1 citrate lyase subunit beta/citryl-CoA lyase [Clostridium saccharoperbutylacetonicum]NSB32745.1 citrate lyase subunit beta/citryl-CoA lyase [Clostridium saccharo
MYKLRRTMMYIPGNNPGMIKDGHIYGADSIMFDLEDSVSINEKDAARFLVYNALKTIDYEGVETVVRINGLDTCGMEDLEAIVRAQPDVIRLPKTESAQDIIDVENEIARIEKEAGIPVGKTKMMAAVEGALGVMNAREIATASKRLMGIAIGAEDYVTDLKTTRSPEGIELLFGRSQIILAARAAGIYAFDTVYSDVNNEEGFENEVRLIKQLGFDGKSVINPRQIGPVHEIYTPSEKEINKSIRVIKAAEEAKKRGSGVVSLDGKMVDKPIIERAQRALMLAEAAGVYVNEGGDENA